MPTHPRRPRALLLALVAGLLPVLVPVLGLGPGAVAETRSCAWVLKVDPAAVNVLFPDEAAHYWTLALPLAPGESLLLSGRYPHSRYFSFTSYDAALRSVDGIADVEIAPDPGSSNPFRPRADRGAARRGYTVRVVSDPVPGTPARNTLYTGSALATVIYRNYRQDRGLGEDGGVGLPRVAVTGPHGTTELPDCDLAEVPDNGLNALLGDASAPAPYPAVLGTSTPQWRKFVNLPTSAAAFATTPATGSAVGDTLAPLTTATGGGGFADNPDNKYVSAVVSSGHAPVVVVRGRMPRFPQTHDGRTTMGRGQLRYWSLCSEEFATGRFYRCLVDDQVPLGPHRRFTVLLSTAADRPANARTGCGIAWLPLGPAPDTVLIERNMLADPGFAHAIQRARPGHEREDLGSYYPRTRYLTTAGAEALGCRKGTR